MSKYYDASLVQIPSGYKAGTLYSVLPANGDGDFDFTRASIATRVNAEGLIETVASGVPRLDYPILNGVVQSCPALLLEPARTNLALQSADFTTTWATSGVTAPTVTANQFVSPDGDTNADRLQIPSLGTASLLFQGISHTSGQQITLSVYIKSNTSSEQYFRIYGDFGVSISSAFTATSQWQRFTYTFTASSTGTRNIGFYNVTNVSSDLQIWGFQAEAGSYATSYIPTSGTTVARAAEVCNGAGTSAEFNDSEGVLFAEISALANDGIIRAIAISDGTGFNRVNIRYTGTSNQVEYSLFVNGQTTKTLFHSILDSTITSKISVHWKTNDLKFYVNGFLVGSISSAVMMPNNTLNQLRFDSGAGLSPFYGKTKQLIAFDAALTDEQLEDLTSWDSFIEMAQAQQYLIY
jgi:hypothetical protein